MAADFQYGCCFEDTFHLFITKGSYLQPALPKYPIRLTHKKTPPEILLRKFKMAAGRHFGKSSFYKKLSPSSDFYDLGAKAKSMEYVLEPYL